MQDELLRTIVWQVAMIANIDKNIRQAENRGGDIFLGELCIFEGNHLHFFGLFP